MPDRSDLAARLRSAEGVAVACAIALPALLALRLPAALDGADSVNFALGLSDYDPALEQPHFPGYPVYIALCRLLVAAGLSEAVALALPGVIASAALVPAIVALGGRLGLDAPSRVCAALLLVAQPVLWLEGPRPMPDLLASACAWSALALALGERPALGGALLGLALGMRIDLAPLGLGVLALPARVRTRFVSGIVLGVALWLPAFVSALGPGGLTRGVAFAVGHFSVWGSTALAGAGRSGAPSGLALGLMAPILPLLAALGATRAPMPLRRFLVCALGPYALWLLLGQNLAAPRHFLPLAPALALLAACAFPAPRPASHRAIAATALAICAAMLVVFARAPHPDGRALSVRVFAFCAECSAIFAGPSQRLLEHYAPAGAPLYRRASLDEIRRDLAAWPMLTGPIGITSELADRAGLATEAVDDVAAGLRLYRIDASALR